MKNSTSIFGALKGFTSQLFLVLFAFFVSWKGAWGQVTITNPGNTTPAMNTTYSSLALAIADVNNRTAISGPVTITLDANTPQTAPAGGYSITNTAMTGGSNTNRIIFDGGGNTITAGIGTSTTTDAFFKIIGADFITIQNFVLSESAGNTTATTQIEWGIALLYSTTTNGAQNITIQNNSITLNRTNANSIGIYSNSTHSASAVGTNATATGAAGGTSGLKVYGNTITNVNQGIIVVGPTAAADANTGIDIGGIAPGTGNTITNFGTTTTSSYINVSGTVNGILVRNSIGFNISYNTITSSNGGVTAGTLNGIHIPAASNTPTITFTNTINNNTIALTTGFSGAINGITYPSGSASSTSILNVNGNNFTAATSTVTSSGAITLINIASTNLTTTINSNTFTNISSNTTGSFTFISHSFTMPASGSCSVSSNSIVTAFNKTGAGGTVTLATTGTSSPSTASLTQTNNNFSNITVTGATAITGFSNFDGSTSSCSKTVTGNTFNNWTGGTSAIIGMTFGYWGGGTTNTLSNNTITNISGQSTITGISISNSFAGTNTVFFSTNTINNLSSTGTGGAVTGITCSNISTVININGNAINTLSSTGAAAVNGIIVSGATTTNIYQNKIYDLSGNNASTTVNGISVTAGTTVNTYNNLIGDLRATAANAANPIIGLNISGGTTVNASFNSIYLDNLTSSGALFGASGIFASTTPTLTLRNNLVRITGTSNGASNIAAHRRSTSTLTSYSTSSNNNLFFAGTPSSTNLIYTENTSAFTNSQQTLATYKTYMSTRDQASVSENPTFQSTTGSSADFLKFNTSVASQIESGGVVISGITTDFAGTTRSASTPDIGAWELYGLAADFTGPNILYTPLSNACASTFTLSATITDASGVPTSGAGLPSLYFSINGGSYTAVTASSIGSNQYTFSFGSSATAGDVISYYIMAQDNASPPNIGSSPSSGASGFTASPPAASTPPNTPSSFTIITAASLGITATTTATQSTVCSGEITSLNMLVTGPSSGVIGSGSTSSSSAPTPFSGLYGGMKGQYILLASELISAGYSAGNITAIGINFSSGITASYTDLTIQIGNTTLNAFNSTLNLETGLNTVYGPVSLVNPTSGVNMFYFSTPFNWNGTSNIIISTSWSNNTTTSTAATIVTTTTSTNLAQVHKRDSYTPASLLALTGTQGSSGSSTVGTARPNFTVVGNKAQVASAYSWSDGSTTIGTSNPQNATVTNSGTTFTCTATVNSCPMTASVTPTVNPLPTAPSATNSTQCGAGIPTASVSDNNSYSTPTFKWYSASTGGTLLQTSTSTTYTASISTTTTFYVAVVNPSTSCESTRSAVTVTVTQPDPISATSSALAICLGQSITLTAANTASTPTQNYTYSWVCATTGSGATSANTNNPASITPSASGAFTYTVTGTDGACAVNNSVSVTVNPLPNITSATATPSTVCSGSLITLTGASVPASAGIAILGSGTLTGTGTAGTFLRQGNTVGNQFKTQYLFTAAELQAAGLVAGNITGLTFDVSAAGGGTASNLTFRLGVTSLTNLTSTYVTGLTQVYTVATYPSSGTVQTGLQSITFNTPFNWDGISNLVLEACSQLATSGTDGTLRSSTTNFVSTIGNNPSVSGCSSTTGGTTYSERPNFRFNGQIGTNQTSTFSWSWNSTPAITTATGTTTETNTGASATTKTYTVTATNATTGCSATSTTSAVTINPATVAPTATNSAHCGSQTPSCSVTGTGTSGNTFAWYTVATGGAELSGQTASTLSSYTVAGNTTFYVSENNGTCQSARTPVTVTVSPPPSITASASLSTVCSGSPSTLSVSSSNPGYTYSWSNSLGTGASVTASPTSNTTYTVTATDNSGGANNGCATTATVAVATNPLPSAISLTPSSTQNLCLGNIQSIVASGGSGSEVSTTALQENFNSATNNWTLTNSSSGGTVANAAWTLRSSGYTYSSTTFNSNDNSQFYMTNSDAQGSGGTTITTLTSPSFSTIGATAGTISFYHYFYSSDAGRVQYSTDGINYTTIVSYSATTGAASSFALATVSLPSGALNQSTLFIRFRYEATYDWYWVIDNVSVSVSTPSISFSPSTDLYTNAGATTTYTGNPTTVYSKPTANRTYTATATTAAGCTTSSTVTINVGAPTQQSVASTDYIWKGTTSSAWGTLANWTQFDGTVYTTPSVVPSSTSVVVIPANNTCVQNQPAIGSSSISVQDFKIESGATTTLNSGAQLTISGTLTNNGTLTLESGATLVQGASSTLAGTGTYNVKQEITGSNNGTAPSGRFWYLGSPVSLASSSAYFTSNAANVVKKRDEVNNAWTALSSGTPENLVVGQGYYTQAMGNATINFTGGLLNNGPITIGNLSRTAGQGFEGFNLVSNPYPSYLDWDAVTKTDVGNTMWYRTASGSTAGSMVFDTYVAGTGGIGTNLNGAGVSNLIPPMQSFWVRVNSGSTTGSLGLTNSMRAHFTSINGSVAGLKSTSNDRDLFLRMNLLQAGKKDQIIVYVNDIATNGFDQFDGEKMMQAGLPQFYTSASGKKITINGLNSAKKQQALPITMELPTTGVHSFVIEDLEISNGLVWLEDKQEEIMQALEPGTVYEFYANSGINAERFVLHFQLIDDATPVNVYNEVNSSTNFSGKGASMHAEAAGVVVIKLPATTEGVTDIQIRDAAGKLVYTGSTNTLETSVQLEQANGIYYVTLNSASGVEVRKVFIQQ